jgi:hypothetical protein
MSAPPPGATGMLTVTVKVMNVASGRRRLIAHHRCFANSYVSTRDLPAFMHGKPCAHFQQINSIARYKLLNVCMNRSGRTCTHSELFRQYHADPELARSDR